MAESYQHAQFARTKKGIANDLVETFGSRINDVSSYWGIGQIQREIEGLASAVAELDCCKAERRQTGQ
jgi:hypothetical protein